MRGFGSLAVCLALLLCLTPVVAGQEPDVGKLTTALSGDSAAAAAAADNLAQVGPAAKPAVPALVKALSSNDTNLRWRAARALGAIGPSAASATQALVDHVTDPEASVRTQSIAALSKVGAKSDAIVTALAGRVADEEPHVRRAAITALRRLQPDRKVLIPALTKAIEDSQPEVAMAAMAAMADAGEAAVPALIEALANNKARHWATVVLGEIGPPAAAAVPALEKLATDPEPEIRMQALIALGQIGDAAKPSLKTIIAELNDEQSAVRYGAAFALGKMRAKEAAEALEKLTSSEDPTLKLVSIWAVARIHPDNAAAIRRAMEAIAAGISSDDPQLSRVAARAMAEIEMSPEAITPAVKAALEEMDPTVIEHVMEALTAVGPRAVPVLTEALKNDKTRGPAIDGLTHIGPDAKAAVPALTAILADKDERIAGRAALALSAIGPDAASAVPALIKLLGQTDPGSKYAAVLALGRIGPGSKSAVPAIEKLITAQEPILAIASVWAVRRIDPANQSLAPVAVPVLVKFLALNDDVIRIQASAALGDLGTAARAAVPTLKKLSEEAHGELQHAASDALAKIQPAAPTTPPPGKAK